MTTHRFSELVGTIPAANRLAEACAFVPCPMFQTLPSAQQERIQEIYRIAAEQTREQMKPIPYPQFSMN